MRDRVLFHASLVELSDSQRHMGASRTRRRVLISGLLAICVIELLLLMPRWLPFFGAAGRDDFLKSILHVLMHQCESRTEPVFWWPGDRHLVISREREYVGSPAWPVSGGRPTEGAPNENR